ncbi:MAG: LemA family protein [Parcubacteria group bacterium]|nr:LemA family protein [Parcubacteria group bacterium]
MSKKLFFLTIAIVLGILAILGVYFFNGYRLLENKEKKVQESWTIIADQYQERLDVLAGLENLTQKSAKEEASKAERTKSIWEVAREANNYKGMLLVTEKIDKEIETIISLVGNNPTLKSSEKYLQFQKRLGETEQKILAEQETYNDAVTEYNRQIKVFPASAVAGPLRLSSYPYYEGMESE